jgi:RNA polymerase subunit RPABC4/transcription elongation factor Spt4
MFCPRCGREIKAGTRFCGECGWAVPAAPVQNAQPVPAAPVQNAQPAEQRCASCGTVLKEGAKFCPNCGAPASVVLAPAPPAVPAPVPPSTDNPVETSAKEAADGEKPEQEKVVTKSNAIDKAVFYHLGSRIYACHLYKDGAAVGNMTDTHGAFIHDVKEWLEKKYDNLVVEIKEEK